MEEQKKKILIGIPCYQNVSAQTLEDYMRMAFYFGRRYPEYDFYLHVKTKSEQFRARNALVMAALDVGADYLLMLDDDHIIDVDDTSGIPGEGAGCYGFLKRLISHDVDIVGPIYYHRGGNAGPVVMEEKNGAFRMMNEDQLTGGLQEVAVQGGGCMLIKMHIFDRIKQPWFEPEHTYGTDVQLCKRAREAGFKVYTDSAIQIGHVMNTSVVVSKNNKDQFRTDTAAKAATGLSNDWHTNNVLSLYKYDAMEYLDIHEETELKALYDDYAYKAMNLSDKYGLGTPEYYGHMGKEQLARQVLYHFSEHPQRWMSFAFMNINAGHNLTGIDFGCGSAPIGFEMLKRGHTMYFFDIDGSFSFEFLKWRIKKYGLSDRAHFNEWPDEKIFSYALFSDSLEHLKDWHEPVLKVVERFIPQGVLFTNYLLLDNTDGNMEHINWDRGEFLKYMHELGMEPISNCVFMLNPRSGGATQ